VPPPRVLTNGDNGHRQQTGHGSAGKCTSDTPQARTREERDSDEDGQVYSVKEVELLRGHVLVAGRQSWLVGAISRNQRRTNEVETCHLAKLFVSVLRMFVIREGALL
jgi:hypothetical protein